MPTKSEQLSAALMALRKRPGVEGSALLSRDGIAVVADLPASYSRETFSAMTAAMLGAAETAMIEIGRNIPDRLILENADTRLIAVGVNDELMLAVLCKSSTPMPAILADIVAAIAQVKGIVG
ncbi:MAG TPA: roadblock/LC7 domain-containing protein [Candidatus Thermoplasmatota archaeon]|nr:roadblock/LC7 domain-containing protein [Candidatus Thermoplasmatota archaeon]